MEAQIKELRREQFGNKGKVQPQPGEPSLGGTPVAKVPVPANQSAAALALATGRIPGNCGEPRHRRWPRLATPPPLLSAHAPS